MVPVQVFQDLNQENLDINVREQQAALMGDLLGPTAP